MALYTVSITNGFGGIVYPLEFMGEENETKTIVIIPYSNYTIHSVRANRVDTYEELVLTETYNISRTGKRKYDFNMPPANVSIFVEFEFIESIIPVGVTYRSRHGRIYTTSFNLLYNSQNEVSSLQSVSFSEWCTHNDFNPVYIEIPVSNSEIITEDIVSISPSRVQINATIKRRKADGPGTIVIDSTGNTNKPGDYSNYVPYYVTDSSGTTIQYNIIEVTSTDFVVANSSGPLNEVWVYYDIGSGLQPGLYTVEAGSYAGTVVTTGDRVYDIGITSTYCSAATGGYLMGHRDDFANNSKDAIGHFVPILAEYKGFNPSDWIGYTPASVLGTFGIVDEYNTILRTWRGVLISSDSNRTCTFYNPILNQSITLIYEDMDYNYAKRTHSLIYGSEQITITFGDYFVVIKQGGRLYRLAYVISD